MIPGGIGWARWWAEFSSERYDDSFRWAILHALSEARSWGHGHIGVEHLFTGCLRADDSLFRAFEQLADPIEVIQEMVQLGGGTLPPMRLYDKSLEQAWAYVERARLISPHTITPQAERVLERAAVVTRAQAVQRVSISHLFVAVVEEGSSILSSALATRGVPRARVDAWVRSRLEWGPLLDLAREASEHDPPPEPTGE